MVPALALQADISGEKTMAKTDILAPDMVKMTEGGTVTLECVVTEHDRRRFMTCVTQQNCFSEMVRAAHLPSLVEN